MSLHASFSASGLSEQMCWCQPASCAAPWPRACPGPTASGTGRSGVEAFDALYLTAYRQASTHGGPAGRLDVPPDGFWTVQVFESRRTLLAFSRDARSPRGNGLAADAQAWSFLCRKQAPLQPKAYRAVAGESLLLLLLLFLLLVKYVLQTAAYWSWHSTRVEEKCARATAADANPIGVLLEPLQPLQPQLAMYILPKNCPLDCRFSRLGLASAKICSRGGQDWRNHSGRQAAANLRYRNFNTLAC